MDSASIQFVVFGLLAALISNMGRSSMWRSVVLLIASLLLIAILARSVLTLVPLAGFLLAGYLCRTCIERGWIRNSTFSIIVLLAFYLWLKKYTFFPQSLLLPHLYFTLGLSYIFFRVLHLVIDAKDSDTRQPVSPFGYLLYTLNFTTLVSGPIQRYEEFAQDQFSAIPIGLDAETVGLQLERLVRGFFKVNVLAMLLNAWQQDALGLLNPGFDLRSRFLGVVELAVIYPFFIYANFSGYIDIVIALARLMRLRLPENFDRPFSASSFLDFWSRWHITLSVWFKNYLYNPLLIALMRRISSTAIEPFLSVVCFFITFFLVGVWHGRTSEFVFYGVLQGTGVSVNKLWQVSLARWLGRKRYRALSANGLYRAAGRGLTFSWFAFTLFWFWADWKQIHAVGSALKAPQWLGAWLAIWLLATAALALWEWLRAAGLSIRTVHGPVLTSWYGRAVFASALGLASLIIVFLMNQPAPDVVYKAF